MTTSPYTKHRTGKASNVANLTQGKHSFPNPHVTVNLIHEYKFKAGTQVILMPLRAPVYCTEVSLKLSSTSWTISPYNSWPASVSKTFQTKFRKTKTEYVSKYIVLSILH